MRLALLLLASLLAAAPAFAGSGADGTITEIRLGEAPPPPPAVDPSRVRAVERFLAARREASSARAAGRRAGLSVPGPKGASAEDLYGAAGSRLVAFDFQDASIERSAPGRFTVDVYLLFADDAGQVVESRDERLTFAGADGAWACASRVTTATIAWDSGAVAAEARTIGASEELDRARAHLRAWTADHKYALAYSVADVVKTSDGHVTVECLRFRSDAGMRGFDVDAVPVVLSRDRGGLRVESD